MDIVQLLKLNRALGKDTVVSGVQYKLISDTGVSARATKDLKTQELVILEGTTKIEDFAFAMCDTLESVTIPQSVSYIGVSTFWECNNLRVVRVPEKFRKEVSFFGFKEGVTVRFFN